MTRVPRPAALPPATDRLVVVEASAGTGKTFFLEHRVADLILGGAELGQILLVTFTDKAVAELRMRIRDLLDRLARVDTDVPGDACWVLDDAARARLRAAVAGFDHAPIFTIHGFCHRLLVEDAFAARRLFDQTQVADEVAFADAFAALLRARFARVAPERDLIAAYLQTGKTVDDLRALLLACARAHAPLRRQVVPEAVVTAADALRSQLGTAAQRDALVAAVKNGNVRRWMTAWLADIGAALARVEPGAPAPQLVAMIDEVREPLTKLQGKLDELGAASPAPPGLTSALAAVLALGSLEEAIAGTLLPAILERIGHDKAEHGLFDYDDMLALVWEALRGERGAALAGRLRARTPWVMIDEFQDTDAVQWSIFQTVWLHPEARGLTIVGDPKQAIYSFRGADVRTYLSAREQMLAAGATRIALGVNRRSTAPLVQAVNHLLVGTATRLLDKGGITYDEPVTASGDIVCATPLAPVVALALSARGSAEAMRAALTRAIGDAIDELRAAPPTWSVRGTPRPFALDQIMVLTRTNKESTEIATALRARGLPCALIEPEGLFETREAADLADVLAAIAAPRDRSLRLRALRTRFFDVPWAQLADVVDGPDHHPYLARIFEWSQLAARRTYETLFRRLIEDSRFAERALVLGGGERAITNTWHLIELLHVEVARSRSDLHELVSQLRRWIADDEPQPDDRDVQRTETDADAIRILTIHKSKGLEAPYVFLYGGITAPPPRRVQTLRDAAGRALVVGRPAPETKRALEHAAEAENQRLAYVALTRAQLRLYLPCFAENSLKDGAPYLPIQRCLVATLPGPDDLFTSAPVALEGAGAPPPPAGALTGLVAPPAPAAGELAPLDAARAGLTMLSYTRLAASLDEAALAARPGDVLALDPAEFDVDDTTGEVGPNELPPGASAGLLLHDVLEVADLERARHAADAVAWQRDPDVRAQLVAHARDRGVAEVYLDHAAALLHRTLTAPLALVDGTQRPALVEATALAREVEFSYPLPARTRGLVKGFIDALVAWDDELWVLDYKSDLLAGDELARAAERRVREHYAVQARLYALAAERLRGRRRLAGLLFAFVRHGVVVPVRLAEDTLAGWARWLAELPIGGGRA